MFRLQDNVPEVYVKWSRDFQLFCRIYDVINNSMRFNAKSSQNLLDPLNTTDNMLQLLATRIGFFPKNEYNTEALREVMSAFPYIVKYKGSKKGIEMALNVILKIENNYKESFVDIDSKNSIVNIYTNAKIESENLLRDVLSYIIPIGYDIVINTYTKADTSRTLSQIGLSENVEQGSYTSSDISIVSNTDPEDALASVGSYTTTEVLGENNL